MQIKGTLSSLVRRSGLMMMADKLKYFCKYIYNYSKNKKFVSTHQDISLPLPYMMFESFNMNYASYFDGGKLTAQWIFDLLSPFTSTQDVHFLDWGCGPARITRHLKNIDGLSAVIYGTDFNQKTVQWCSDNIPGVLFSINSANPPLHYPDETFNIKIGISIFTHLSEANHHVWIKELSRVMRQDGVALITTHGDVFKSKLTASERMLYEHNLPVIRGNVKEGHRVYTAFQPTQWIENCFQTCFKVLIHHPGMQAKWGLEQNYWILKKL